MGKDNGGGNPNHDPKTGRFISSSGVDIEPNKDKQISKNEGAANIAKAQEKHGSVPKDLRDKHIGTFMPSSYKETSQEYYSKVADIIKDESIKDLDVKNIKQVIDKAEELLSKAGHVQPSCYTVASSIAAIFDKRGVQYKCLVGLAGDNLLTRTAKNIEEIKSNHVWIEAFGKRYEFFRGQEGNIPHFTITDDIQFRKESK